MAFSSKFLFKKARLLLQGTRLLLSVPHSKVGSFCGHAGVGEALITVGNSNRDTCIGQFISNLLNSLGEAQCLGMTVAKRIV